MTMEQSQGGAQFSTGAPQKSVAQTELEAFQEGIELGKQYASVAARRVAAWAEENPGQVIAVGALAGFILGKMFFRPPRRVDLRDLDLE